MPRTHFQFDLTGGHGAQAAYPFLGTGSGGQYLNSCLVSVFNATGTENYDDLLAFGIQVPLITKAFRIKSVYVKCDDASNPIVLYTDYTDLALKIGSIKGEGTLDFGPSGVLAHVVNPPAHTRVAFLYPTGAGATCAGYIDWEHV